jgi:hypothetical protein
MILLPVSYTIFSFCVLFFPSCTRFASSLASLFRADHNPQRDPAPSKKIIAPQGIDLSGKSSAVQGLTISSEDMAPAMQNFRRVPIQKAATVRGVSHDALNAGFVEADHQYFYSRMPKSGWDSPLFRAGVSYLVDGVLDVNAISSATGVEGLLSKAGLGWITKGTCDAGDIRVHFEAKRLPQTASLVGQQIQGRLAPMIYSNGAERLFLRSGLLTLDTLLSLSLSDAQWWQNVYRLGLILCVIIGGILYENATNFHHPDWKLGGVLGSCVFTTVFAIMSCFFYGVDDSIWPIGFFVGSVSSLVFMLFSSGSSSSKKMN